MKKFSILTLILLFLSLGAAPVMHKVGSYNLRTNTTRDLPNNGWEQRAPRCLELLKTEKFDIFGSQETQQCHIDKITASGYKAIGLPRDDSKTAEHSTIFYNPEVLELRKTETFWLSETPNVPGSKSWNTACPRIFTVGFFTHKASGKIFIFVNTHLDHKSKLARENGIELIIKYLSKFKLDYPYILTGDFNARPDSEVYKKISGFMSDARHISEKTLPGAKQTFHAYQADPAKRRMSVPIDYIFVNESEVKVKSFQVIDDFKNGLSSSDHFPLSATIVLQ